MSDWILFANRLRGQRSSLPPHGEVVEFDEDGMSGPVSADTAREMIGHPYIFIHSTPQTVAGEVAGIPGSIEEFDANFLPPQPEEPAAEEPAQEPAVTEEPATPEASETPSEPETPAETK